MYSLPKDLTDCLTPFSFEDGAFLEAQLKKLNEVFADPEHKETIKTLFFGLLSIVGKLPLSAGSAFKKPCGCIEASVELACQALVQLRNEIEFFRLPLTDREKEIATSKLAVLVSCLYLYVKLTAMSFEVRSSDGSVFCFSEPFEEWCRAQEGKQLTLLVRSQCDEAAASANTLLLVHKAIPSALYKRFAESFRARLPFINKLITGEIGAVVGEDRSLLLLIGKAEIVVMGREQLARIKHGDLNPGAFHSLFAFTISKLFEDELSMEAAGLKYDEDKSDAERIDRTITFLNGKVYAVVDEFFPLLTNKLKAMFPRQNWKGSEVLRTCCECGFFELPENTTFTDVWLYKDIWKKGGKKTETLPVKGIAFTYFPNFIARNSGWFRTYQSWMAGYEAKAEVIAREAVKLPDPLAQMEWNLKGQIMAQAIQNGIEAIYKNLDEEEKAAGLRLRERFDAMLRYSEEQKEAKERQAQEAKDACIAPALQKQAQADAKYAREAYDQEKKSKSSLFEERHNKEAEAFKRDLATQEGKTPQSTSDQPTASNPPSETKAAASSLEVSSLPKKPANVNQTVNPTSDAKPVQPSASEPAPSFIQKAISKVTHVSVFIHKLCSAFGTASAPSAKTGLEHACEQAPPKAILPSGAIRETPTPETAPVSAGATESALQKVSSNEPSNPPLLLCKPQISAAPEEENMIGGARPVPGTNLVSTGSTEQTELAATSSPAAEAPVKGVVSAEDSSSPEVAAHAPEVFEELVSKEAAAEARKKISSSSNPQTTDSQVKVDAVKAQEATKQEAKETQAPTSYKSTKAAEAAAYSKKSRAAAKKAAAKDAAASKQASNQQAQKAVSKKASSPGASAPKSKKSAAKSSEAKETKTASSKSTKKQPASGQSSSQKPHKAKTEEILKNETGKTNSKPRKTAA